MARLVKVRPGLGTPFSPSPDIHTRFTDGHMVDTGRQSTETVAGEGALDVQRVLAWHQDARPPLTSSCAEPIGNHRGMIYPFQGVRGT